MIIGFLTIVSLGMLVQKQLGNNAILLVFVISLSAMLGLTVLLFKLTIGRRVNRLIERLKQSCVEGDLTQRMELTGNDEISVIAGCIDDFLGRVHDTIAQISNASSQVVDSVTELNAVTATVSQGALHQQQETGAIASAVTEMSATSANVNDSASGAATQTTNADSAAKNGKEIVNQTVEGINALSSDVSSAADVIKNLAQQADSIGSVLDVIRGIAEQTNLLALNAAIEAARAGEQGRGFAVVADEVRTLASRTQESTAEIQTMIESLQSGTKQAVEVMDQSQCQAVKTVEIAATAGQSLDAIVSAMDEISQMNNQIAHAASEQQRTANAVLENVMSIQTVAEETASSSELANQSSDNVSKQVALLQSMIGQFRL